MRLISQGACLLLIMFFSLFATLVEAAGNAVGRVVWVKGNFYALGAGNAKRSLERAGIFYQGDTLVTDAGSQAQIVFSDNSLMTFREGTRFRVDQYQLKSGGGSYAMTLAEGGFRTVTGTIASNNPSGYQIKTPVATIGVRGTEFIVYYKNGRLYVGRISGKPCVFDRIKRVEVCLTPQSPYVLIVGGENPSVTSDMPSELGGSNDLTIVPAMIQPGGNGPGGNGPGGQVNSFCVT